MPSCLPVLSDFPKSLSPIIRHSSDSASSPLTKIVNVVILLHGLGDTSLNFSSFATALNLPETLHLTLQAPFLLLSPLLGDRHYYHWADDVLLHSVTGDINPDAGFSKASSILSRDVIEEILIAKCEFRAREILILGLGQGGMVGLATAAALGTKLELGGVISIGGPMPSSCMLVNGPGIKTSVLLLGGTNGSISRSDGRATAKGTFENVEVVEWKRDGDGMPRNREETLPLMEFLARRLKSIRGLPEGSVEIG